jgi:hypothetical protein
VVGPEQTPTQALSEALAIVVVVVVVPELRLMVGLRLVMVGLAGGQ